MMRVPLAIVILHSLAIMYGIPTYVPELRQDTRTSEWLLIKRWTPMILIIMTYFVGVMIGPKLMENRQAFSLGPLLKFYNLFQVILSTYMFKEFLFGAIEAGYSLGCQAVDYSHSPSGIRMAAASWWYFFSKIIDTLDTLFFILRKKNSQISFLHVYHHGSMIFNWYLAAKYTPGGLLFFQCMLNSLVHTVMYTYYFLSSFGPRFQKYLWWKRYLTQMQLIQFALIIVHFAGTMTSTCNFPDAGTYYAIGYVVALSSLFFNFYFETYSRESRERKAALEASAQRRFSYFNIESQKTPMGLVDRSPIAVFAKNYFVK